MRSVPFQLALIWAVPLGAVALSTVGCTQGLGGGGKSEPKVTVKYTSTEKPTESTGGGEAPPTAVAGFGTLKGRVVLQGDAPPLAPLLAKGGQTNDTICSENAVPNESVVSQNGGLANVYIYMKKKPDRAIPAAPAEPLIVDQQGCKFVPHASIARVGQQMILKNADPIAHNTKAGSTFNINNLISPGEDGRKGSSLAVKKTEKEPVRFECSIHSWMSCYVLSLDHPWGVVTDAEGKFEIKDVPAGEWEFVVWHEKADKNYIRRSWKVKIEPDKTKEEEIQVPVSLFM